MECREDDDDLRARARRASSTHPTRRCVDAERAFLAELGGDCSLPAGAHAVLDGDDLTVDGVPRLARRSDDRARHRVGDGSGGRHGDRRRPARPPGRLSNRLGAGREPGVTVLGVELSPTTATGYARLAFDQMLAVADRLGDERVNERPIAPHVNSVAAPRRPLLRGRRVLARPRRRRPTVRPRPRRRVHRHGFGRRAARSRRRHASPRWRPTWPPSTPAIDSPHADGLAAPRRSLPGTDASLVVHVIEELFQHLGHCELAADALHRDDRLPRGRRAGRPGPAHGARRRGAAPGRRGRVRPAVGRGAARPGARRTPSGSASARRRAA